MCAPTKTTTGLVDASTGESVPIRVIPDIGQGQVVYNLWFGQVFVAHCVNAGVAITALLQIEAALRLATGKS